MTRIIQYDYGLSPTANPSSRFTSYPFASSAAISALYTMNQSEESTSQVELSEELEMTAEEAKEYEVELDEGVQAGVP